MHEGQHKVAGKVHDHVILVTVTEQRCSESVDDTNYCPIAPLCTEVKQCPILYLHLNV